MKGERDLSRITDCAYTEALLHPGWPVETDLPPLLEAEVLPEGAVPWGRRKPVDHAGTFARAAGDHALLFSNHEPYSASGLCLCRIQPAGPRMNIPSEL